MRIVGVLIGLGVAMGCTRPPLPEPAFVETRGSPIITTCIAPSAWNCYDRAVTRKDALDALELADRDRAEEEEALTKLRSYLACHPWDLDLTFELARRNVELNRSRDATYLFLRVAENSEDDRALSSFMRALEALNATAVSTSSSECYDEMDRRVGPQLARLCAPSLVTKHPGRAGECSALRSIASDLERVKMNEAIR